MSKIKSDTPRPFFQSSRRSLKAFITCSAPRFFPPDIFPQHASLAPPFINGWVVPAPHPHPCFVPAVLGSYHVISFGQVSLTIFSEICDQFPNIAITPWLLSKQSFVCNFYTWRMKWLFFVRLQLFSLSCPLIPLIPFYTYYWMLLPKSSSRFFFFVWGSVICIKQSFLFLLASNYNPFWFLYSALFCSCMYSSLVSFNVIIFFWADFFCDILVLSPCLLSNLKFTHAFRTVQNNNKSVVTEGSGSSISNGKSLCYCFPILYFFNSIVWSMSFVHHIPTSAHPSEAGKRLDTPWLKITDNRHLLSSRLFVNRSRRYGRVEFGSRCTGKDSCQSGY